jgi:cytochrome-b5 reductase
MIHGEMIMRPYTPTSLSDQRGSFELVVKVYHAHEDPKHPAGGKMSQYLDQMHIGDTIDVKGPMGRLVYHGRGWFSIGGRTLHASRVGMLAGGTGITPMYQIIQAIMRDDFDETQVALIFANKTPEDILLRPELDSLASTMQAARGKLHVWYTVDRLPLEHGPESWHYGIGHVDADMIAAHLPPPSPETLMLMCGPPPFVHYACEPNLEKLGHESENRFVF